MPRRAQPGAVARQCVSQSVINHVMQDRRGDGAGALSGGSVGSQGVKQPGEQAAEDAGFDDLYADRLIS